MHRREFTKDLLTTITGFALMDSLFSLDAFDQKIKPHSTHWAIELNTFCQDLKTNSLTPIQWQQKINELYDKVPLQDILSFIDFDKLLKGFTYPDLGVHTKPVQFPRLSGLPENTVFVKKIFGMKKDRAIIPHGHSNMASAHLVLKGEMHLRQYEKIRQENQHLVIKPVLDIMARAGDNSSVSDDKDNVHWFIAQTETAFTFDVIMLNLGEKNYDIHNLDMEKAEDLKNGNLRAPVLDVNTALKKYGKHHH